MDSHLAEKANAPLPGTKAFGLTINTYSRVHELILHASPSWPRMLLHVVVQWGNIDKGEVEGSKHVLHMDKVVLRCLLALLMRDLVSTWHKHELSHKHERTQDAIDELITLYAQAYGTLS